MKIKRSLLLLGLLASLLLSVHCEDDDEDDDVEVEVEDDEEQTREKPVYRKPVLRGNAHFAEPFHTKEDFLKRWVISDAKKDNTDESISKYDGKWSVEEPSQNAMVGDLGLILKSKAKHHAVSAPLAKPFDFSGKPFIMQYEVRFQNGMECGGAYVKLLSQENQLLLSKFHDKTPYTIMFGPDKCGNDHKLHFIFRHKNPKTGEIEEKHAKKPSSNIDSFFSDKKTHLYTLVVKPDNTFEIKIDGSIVNQGSLLEDFSPSVNPPKNIEDPEDKKPDDWDEREKIADPDATKPDDWDESQPEMITDEDAVKPDGWLDDEPKLIPDPTATKPEDWDDEMDGEWEAPLIENEKCTQAPGCGEWKRPTVKNPKYKGKWHAPIIDNPSYKGIWKPKMISNPNYFEDNNPYQMTPISGLGLELWSMTEDILFDNFLITDDFDVVESWTESSWVIKNMEEKSSSSSLKNMFQDLLDATKDRPWLWAVFIVVIAIPLVLIFIYCCMTPKNIWSTLKSSADQRPWLWAVYVVVLLLPVVLLSICFCPKSGPIKPEDLAASRKKTDEPSPDDDEEEQDKNKASVGPGGDNQATTKSKKSDLDSQPDEDAADDADEEEEEEEDKVKESPRQRKRRARKD